MLLKMLDRSVTVGPDAKFSKGRMAMTHADRTDLKPPNWAQPIFDDLRELLITIHRCKSVTLQDFEEDDAVNREIEDVWSEAKRLAQRLEERRDTFPT